MSESTLALVPEQARWFRPVAPVPAVAHVLECTWTAVADGEHRLIPDGSMDLLWFPDASGRGAVWLCGPDTRPWTIDLPAGTPIAGVRFRPGAAPATFGTSSDVLRDRRVRLDDLVGGGSERRLLDRLEAGTLPRGAVLEAWVARRSERLRSGTDPIVALATEARQGVRSVDDLADRAGLSARQLHRRFTTSVGYGPAFFARVARLQRFMCLAARHPRRGLAGLSVGAGYHDQPHLARDCRELADATPAELRDGLHRTSAALVTPRVRSVQDRRLDHGSRWSA